MILSDIVIATHGAFISYVIYMRKNSLLVQLIGNYNNIESINFEMFTKMILIQYESCMVSNLINFHQSSYFVSNNEINQISTIVKTYIDRMLIV